ncbi:GNAT family N-acetyltransferase [Aquisphaera insulae]|uniref:GNAT family N-acetyltransferase n=1 Tax=Aquisphaera insulae TaxID=2712864 RepID=UPI00196A8565|nr:GNAT family N-acetyltransferase [Aquisphaera insulae]
MTAPASPRLQLETLYVLDGRGRIACTREPRPSPGPRFALIRGVAECAWAVRADIADEVAEELAALASRERPSGPWERPPTHAGAYQAVLGGRIGWWGPAFAFPEGLRSVAAVEEIHDESRLGTHFSGWVAGEFAAGASPVMALIEDGAPVSVCFCARRSDVAAEAGLETAANYRRRGHAARVTSAWADAVRASGRTPLYSTSWDNPGSLAVARSLGLAIYATDWSVA